MATQAGMMAFTDERVNNQFKKMFQIWSTFLVSPASCYALTDAPNGWFSPGALEAMPDFVNLYKCDPSATHYAFKSWDDFFTRQFRDGVRPITSPDDDSVINSACESSVYRIAYDIKAVDTFWIKSQPYSVNTMLNGDPFASQFVGGTVYQAFLGPTYYHRWHSPVNGKVVKTVLVPGLYYAQAPAMGFLEPEDLGDGNPEVSLNFDPDPNVPSRSQSFVTTTATRALMFIEADNPKIGLMCLMAVGMAEVSTCEITVKEGQRIRKGDEMGMFHFGGSTYCMLFRPATIIAVSSATEDTDAVEDTNSGVEFSVQVGDYVKLNTAIATVL
jgi:phosphatidylserine decarboxylase